MQTHDNHVLSPHWGRRALEGVIDRRLVTVYLYT